MEEYIIVPWPDIQYLMDEQGFSDNCCLIDDLELNEVGSNSYFVNKQWFNNTDFGRL